MSLLSDLISQAKRQIKTDTGGVKNTFRVATSGNLAKSTASSAVRDAVDSTLGKATGGISKAINVGAKGVNSALSDALHGNFSSAVQKLEQTPDAILGSLSKNFGLSSGAKLRGPSLPNFGTGAGSYSSSNPQGVALGNSLAGALARTDPMLSFNWYAVLPDIAPIGGALTTLPWYFTEEATLPFRNFEVRTIFREGNNQHFPSIYNVDSLRLAIYQDSANVAQRYLQAWQGAILKPTASQEAAVSGGGYGRPSGYKKSIFIYLVNVAKQELAMLEYTECWPQTMDAYTLNSGASDRILNHVTFSVRDVFITLFDLAAVSSNTLDSLSPGEQFV